MSTPGRDNDTIQQKRQQRQGVAAAGGVVTLAQGILQAQKDREAGAIEQTALVRQAVDRSIQVQEGFQRQQGISEVQIGESPGSSEQLQRSIQEAAGQTAVDQLIINDELKAQLDAIKNRFKNRDAEIALATLGSVLG